MIHAEPNGSVYEYDIRSDGTAQLQSCPKGLEALALPEAIDGHPVATLSRGALDCLEGLRRLQLPATFAEDAALQCAELWDLEWIDVGNGNPRMRSVEGILYSADGTRLTACPRGRKGTLMVPAGVLQVGRDAFAARLYLDSVVFQDGLEVVEEGAFFECNATVTLPESVHRIEPNAFGSEYGGRGVLRAPRRSLARRWADEHRIHYMPSDCPVTWDPGVDGSDPAARDGLRRQAWRNTLEIVQGEGYTLPDGRSVLMEPNDDMTRGSRFHNHRFIAARMPLSQPPEITVTDADPLEVARAWADEGLEVCVLNVTDRHMPGIDLENAGTQRDDLLCRTDCCRDLFRYTPLADDYGLSPSAKQYPLDLQYGGIYTPGVTVFRAGEAKRFALLEKPWKVNVITVSDLNDPDIPRVTAGDRHIPGVQLRIVTNKIRTLLNIACDRGQVNLVLGTPDLGASFMPPAYIAGCFKSVLCEAQYEGAFRRICFAVVSDAEDSAALHAFRGSLHGFVPEVSSFPPASPASTVRQIAVARNAFALLRRDGSADIVDIRTGAMKPLERFEGIREIAAGFDHFLGRTDHYSVIVGGSCRQADQAGQFHCFPVRTVAACEGHSAAVTWSGRVKCVDEQHYEVPAYAGSIAGWHGVTQLALTLSQPFGLARDGRFLSTDPSISAYFNQRQSPISQIAAFGCYYSSTIVAALYSDGRVRARWEGQEVESVRQWRRIKQIACCDETVISLNVEGLLRIAGHQTFVDGDGKPVDHLNNIVTFDANFKHLVALDDRGRILILSQGRPAKTT